MQPLVHNVSFWLKNPESEADRDRMIEGLKTFADQNTYQQHPIHQQFVERCSHLWEKVVVYKRNIV